MPRCALMCPRHTKDTHQGGTPRQTKEAHRGTPRHSEAHRGTPRRHTEAHRTHQAGTPKHIKAQGGTPSHTKHTNPRNDKAWSLSPLQCQIQKEEKQNQACQTGPSEPPFKARCRCVQEQIRRPPVRGVTGCESMSSLSVPSPASPPETTFPHWVVAVCPSRWF